MPAATFKEDPTYMAAWNRGAAQLGLTPQLYQDYSLNPAAFNSKYGQYADPATGVYNIPASETPQLFTGSGGGENQDLANINYILNPNFDTTETETNAAEQSLGQGTFGSGFASGTRGKLLESERLARFQLGHNLLEPYLQRQFQAGEGAADRAARLNEIAAQGAQALQQLQLEQAGATARSTAEQNAAMQRQVLAGQQAMNELRLRETGETSRLNTSIAGNLAGTRLGILGNIAGQQIQRTPAVTPGQNYTTGFDWVTQSHTVTPRPSTPTGVAGANTIDSILKRYGLLG